MKTKNKKQKPISEKWLKLERENLKEAMKQIKIQLLKTKIKELEKKK